MKNYFQKVEPSILPSFSKSLLHQISPDFERLIVRVFPFSKVQVVSSALTSCCKESDKMTSFAIETLSDFRFDSTLT